MAIKRRDKHTSSKELSFINRANSNPMDEKPNPDAKRDFKHIRFPLNEYESNLLDTISKQSKRSKLSVLRAGLFAIADKEGINT